jgi:hypothetical protein
MRSLAQRDVLINAGYAAVITALACYPRLAIWLDRPYTILFSCVMILWTGFVLWAFVFAWQPKYAHRPVISYQFPIRLWAMATLYGVVWAMLLHWLMDPQLRVTTPKDYPTDWLSWIAMCLFALSLDTLFLCFAPFAFFIRLTRKPDVSLALTVIFGIFAVYFYLKGGALLVWWVVLLSQLRHAYDLLAGR